jgi:hypothetical protein
MKSNLRSMMAVAALALATLSLRVDAAPIISAAQADHMLRRHQNSGCPLSVLESRETVEPAVQWSSQYARADRRLGLKCAHADDQHVLRNSDFDVLSRQSTTLHVTHPCPLFPLRIEPGTCRKGSVSVP